MIAVDTNILVYAHRADSRWHDPAAKCIKQLAEGKGQWMIPWPCVHEFLAIVTHPRIYDPPTPLEAALSQLDFWFGSPSLGVAGESSSYWKTLKEVVGKSKTVGPAVHDARIAAICIENAVDVLYTADRDFLRFADLKTTNPLV